MTQKKGGEDEMLIGQQLPSSGSRNDNIAVEVVTTDEEASVLPIAESIAVPVENPQLPKPPTSTNYNTYNNSTNTTTVQDSGFDCLLCGDVKVKRIRPGANVFLSLCGDVYIDMREEDYPPGSTFNIHILRLCGNVRMIVPRGTLVRARRLLLCGDRDIHVREAERNESPQHTITINVLMLCGDFKVRSDFEDM